MIITKTVHFIKIVKIEFIDLFKSNNIVQSNCSILSKVIVLTNYKSTDTQTDTFAKTIFSGSEGLKTWTFDKNGGGVHILDKSNTFSDENVKMMFLPFGTKIFFVPQLKIIF